MSEIEKSQFTFLSWNLCMMQRSDAAPVSWRVDQTEAEVRELVLELQPDFVFFQELPGMVPFVETHDLIPANTVSHSGNIATIAKKELMDDLESRALGKFAVITRIKSAGFAFANVHLEPGGNGNFKRMDMLSQIVRACDGDKLVIAGDTNTRVSEEAMIGSLGLEGERPSVPTWNSKRNRFRDGGREYTTYYTRYFHTNDVRVRKAKVWDKPVSADGRMFYLSDHFAISGTVCQKEK